MAPDVHELVSISSAAGHGSVALCSCGWHSGYQLTGGLAGAVWDAHAQGRMTE